MSTKGQVHSLTLVHISQIQYFQTSFPQQPIGPLIWRVERVIILFCYFNCNLSIHILVFMFLLLLLFLFYLSNFTTVILDPSITILPF